MMLQSTEPPPPPNYIVLNDNRARRRPPTYPLGRNAHRDDASWFGGSRFLKCMCWCYCVLFVIILLLGGLLFYAYTFYKPKLPSYEMLDFEVIAFNAQPDFSLYTEFQVTVWTENPNLFIGLTYEEGSAVSILFEHSPLCFGKLPNIHQGHNNVTMIKVVLKGKSTEGRFLWSCR
ncbi:hypothetical protein Nepgr_000441 [Nepenthes gracilis]|uniref:Late embryogenesis abundant protein LEA-2 subgroup domain-containing protein n=1 Tax=Nepenthes gracilis TaxID=150966 RepID=A0AAD3P3U3_NEPGR|nr:hypothetical protein Nepgr_000441 [Nepenthes gracilis]